MKKRIIYTVLVIAMLLTLCACGNKAAGNSEPDVTASPAASVVPAKIGDTEGQKQLIMSFYDTWKYTDDSLDWYYAICDLDANGRLEVITASVQGSGYYTYADFWQVSADGKSLERCDISSIDSLSWPDIIVDSVDCYSDGSDRYYAFADLMKTGAEGYNVMQNALKLSDNRVTVQLIAYESVRYDKNLNESRSYYDADGKGITEAQYESAVTDFFKNMTKTELPLEWTRVGS